MIYYKIRNKESGLFHKGGMCECWSEEGKIWTTLGKLRSMITMNLNNCYTHNFSNWEIVEYEVKEAAVKSLHEVIKPEKLVTLIKKF